MKIQISEVRVSEDALYYCVRLAYQCPDSTNSILVLLNLHNSHCYIGVTALKSILIVPGLLIYSRSFHVGTVSIILPLKSLFTRVNPYPLRSYIT